MLSVYTFALCGVLYSGPASGFVTTRYLGQRCSGEEEFSGTLGVQDGCVTTGAGRAESVIVKTQSTDQEGDLVAFYKTPDCDVNELTMTTTGGPEGVCVNIDDTGNLVYMSFNVLR